MKRARMELVDEWVEALTSGEYQQGKDLLASCDGKFCCLGVLIDVAVDGDWEKVSCQLKKGESYEVVTSWGINPDCGQWGINPDSGQPHATMMPIGLARDLLGEQFAEDMYDLASLNDQGESFESIAKMIERKRKNWSA